MRKRMLLLVAPLAVVVLVAGVAFAAPGGEHADDAKLDKLHVVRPIAASPHQQDPEARRAFAAEFGAYLAALREQALSDFLESLGPPPEAEQPAPESPVTRTPVYSDSYVGGFLSCVRHRESGGDYTVHNYQGSGAAGAYQMMPGTWNSIAASVGRADLVGLDPAAASPADQDVLAAALYAQQGSAPWGGIC